MEDARGIWDVSAHEKRKEDSTFFEFEKATKDFYPKSVLGIGPAKADDMLLFPSAWTYEAGLPTEAWILVF